MKQVLAALILLAAAAPSRADDLFGISNEDGQALVAQAQAQQHEERLRELGWRPSNLPSISKALGLRVSPASRMDCIYDAVAARLGADPRANVEYPDVLFSGDVDLAGYQAAFRAQFPSATVPDQVRTVYMPGYNVIYLADSASVYEGASTIDAALAAQYARFIDGVVRNVSDLVHIDDDAEAVSSWYQVQYPAGTSSCAR